MNKIIRILFFLNIIFYSLSAQTFNTGESLQKIYDLRMNNKFQESFNLTKETFLKMDLLHDPYSNAILNLLFDFSKKFDLSVEDLYIQYIREKISQMDLNINTIDTTKNYIKVLLCFKYIADKDYFNSAKILKKADFAFSYEIYLLLLEKALSLYNYELSEKIYNQIKNAGIKAVIYNIIIQSKLASYSNAIATLNRIDISEFINSDPIYSNIYLFFINKISPIELLDKLKSLKLKSENDTQCIANFYIGFKYINEGNEIMANKYFTESISYGSPKITEFKLSQKYLSDTDILNKKIDLSLKTIAVLDLDANGFTVNESKIASDVLTSYLIKKNKFNVIERAKMKEILIEQGFQQSGCVSDECVIEAGNLLGVELMLAGSINRFGTLNLIDLRIISVNNGKILKSSSYHFEGEKELIITKGLISALNQLLN